AGAACDTRRQGQVVRRVIDANVSSKPSNSTNASGPEARGGEDLDTRVASLLAEMDEAQQRVTKQLDWPAGSEQDALDQQLSQALAETAAVADSPPPQMAATASADVAAGAIAGTSIDDALAAITPATYEAVAGEFSQPAAQSDAGEGASEAMQAPVMAAAAAEPAAMVSAAQSVAGAPAKAPTDDAMAALDAQLAQAVPEITDDDFADASEVLGPAAEPGMGMPRSEQAEAGEAAELATEAPAAAALAPVTDDDFAAPEDVAAPGAMAAAPVAAAAIASSVVAASPAPAAPVAPPARPAPAPVRPAPAKPAAAAPAANVKVEPKVTLSDMFWRVATPVVEPIALQLGRMPIKTQHTLAWIGSTTLFVAVLTWAFVIFGIDSKPPSHLAEEAAAKSSQTSHNSHDDAPHDAPKTSSAKKKPATTKAAGDGHHDKATASGEHGH
nr:hypothetical protein [Phycisphaerales bacterium]